MMRLSVCVVLVGCLSVTPGASSSKYYEDLIKFTAFSHFFPNGEQTRFGDDLKEYNCIPYGQVTLIAHGWKENINKTRWIREMIENFLTLRGNCVFFMDYSYFSSTESIEGYLQLWRHFYGISDVLKKKLKDLGDPKNIVLFGFSFGARLVVDAAYNLALEGKKVDKIYACDPAGPGFTAYPADTKRNPYRKDPMKAAKFVQCINTSADKGTNAYNCHQNWRMGVCGQSQPGAGTPPMGSHGLCPYFFNESFKQSFTPNNHTKCKSTRKAKNIPSDLRMGPTEDRTLFTGDIFSDTGPKEPWNIVN